MNASFARQIIQVLFIVTGIFSCDDRSGDRDRSHPVETYTSLGMPDPDKQWTLDDYTQAHNVLAQLKWEKPLELPVKDSERSGRLFERMVSLDYLSFLQDSTMSLNEKAARISEFTRVYDYWMDVYTVPILKGNRYHREIVDIQLFNLQLMEAMVNLAHQINKSDDPADVALHFGYEPIKQNYLTSVITDLRTQSNTSQFLKEDLDRMADSIYASVMRNKQWMDSSAVNQLSRSLQLVVDSTSSDHIRSKYNSLERSLKGT